MINYVQEQDCSPAKGTNNQTGFSAISAGYYNEASFSFGAMGLGIGACFGYRGGYPEAMEITYNSPMVNFFNDGHPAYSIRCVRN